MDEPEVDDLKGNITFTAYPLQQANWSNLVSCIELARLSQESTPKLWLQRVSTDYTILVLCTTQTNTTNCLEILRLIPGTYRVNATIAIRMHSSDFAIVRLRICIELLIRLTDVLDCMYAILFYSNHRNVSASRVVRTRIKLQL
jgi:hypothetical protein